MALSDAAKGNHLGTMHFLVKECGATDWDCAMKMAASHGHVLAMQQLHSWGANSDFAVQLAMYAAAGGGHVAAMTEAKKMGAKKESHDEALEWAAAFGKVDIMKLLRDSPEWGLSSPTDAYNNALRAAVESDTNEPDVPNAALRTVESDADADAHNVLIQTIELLRAWGANDWDGALCAVSFRGRLDLMRLSRDWGATKLDDALMSAVEGGRVESARLLLDFSKSTSRTNDAGTARTPGSGPFAGQAMDVHSHSAVQTRNAQPSIAQAGQATDAQQEQQQEQEQPDKKNAASESPSHACMNEALCESAGRDHVSLMKLLLERHAYTQSAVEEALVMAATAGSLSGVCTLVKVGRVRNFTAALDAACEERAELWTEASERSQQRLLDISATVGGLQALQSMYEG